MRKLIIALVVALLVVASAGVGTFADEGLPIIPIPPPEFGPNPPPQEVVSYNPPVADVEVYIFRVVFSDGISFGPYLSYGSLAVPCDIDVSNGTWRVQISEGTLIRLDASPYSQLIEIIMIGADGSFPYYISHGSVEVSKL